MAISLKTIAARCGKDVSTISRALHDDPRVKQSTRDEIQAVAVEMGYSPNLAARSLRLGATKTIWFFAKGTENPMVREAAESAAKFLSDADYDLLLTLHSNDEAVFQRLLSRIEQGVCDGAIIVPNGTMGQEQLQRLAEMHYPIAFLDRHLEACDIPVFTTDNYQAARDLLKRCASQKIDSVISLFRGNTVEDERYRGVLDEAEHLGLKVTESGSLDDALGEVHQRLAILGSSQSTVCSYYAAHNETLRARDITFGVFDGWVGEPFPAKVANVCKQDFESMANFAVKSLLASIETEHQSGFQLTTVPYKAIISIHSSSD